jgi:hypothetical protein
MWISDGTQTHTVRLLHWNLHALQAADTYSKRLVPGLYPTRVHSALIRVIQLVSRHSRWRSRAQAPPKRGSHLACDERD